MRKFYRSLGQEFSYKDTSRRDRLDSERGGSDQERRLEYSEKTYERFIVQGLRYITTDLLALRRMRLSEYKLQMRAVTLRKADEEENMAKLAFYIRAASSVNKKGEYVYKTHKALFDAGKVESRVFDKDGSKEVFDRLRKIALRLRERR